MRLALCFHPGRALAHAYSQPGNVMSVMSNWGRISFLDRNGPPERQRLNVAKGKLRRAQQRHYFGLDCNLVDKLPDPSSEGVGLV